MHKTNIDNKSFKYLFVLRNFKLQIYGVSQLIFISQIEFIYYKK